MEYQGFKYKQTKNGKDMWYRDGRLCAANTVPENVKAHLTAAVDRPKSTEKVDGSDLHGFTEGETTKDQNQAEINKQQETAQKVLADRFPEFNFQVEYQPSFIKEGRTINPVYKIYVLSGDILEKTMRFDVFDLNVLRENIEAMIDGWDKTGRTRAPRRGEKLGEKTLGEGKVEKTHIREISIPRA